jgi:cytochrome c peroxidase
VHNPFLDGGIVPLGLIQPQIDELVAFLATLTSPEYAKAPQVEYQKQFRLSRTIRPRRDTAAVGHKERNRTGISGPFANIGPNQMP